MTFLQSFAIPFLAVAVSLALPGAARAVGSDTSEPPKPTETTTSCEEGLVWDDKQKKCVKIEESQLENDALFRAVRELAHAGRTRDAQAALDRMAEGDSDRVLTYRGFLARKAGRIEEGKAFYDAALAANPDNLLARSYMGQGLVEQGEFEMASAQLAEIVRRGGAGTWAERALRIAIETGATATW
jgi:thioredoxin-like negative regulator of GroEL